VRTAAAGFCLCAAFTWAVLQWQTQQTPIVRPTEVWHYWRIGHHVVLIALMLAATATDFRDYLIPDAITIPGLVFGVTLATLSGDLQIEHVWVDWNQEQPQLQGPYVPAWLAWHPHWHGLVWSLTGAAAGAGGIWLIRGLSSLALGRETMGFGDVTLAAMLGSFLGWQPIAFVVVLAPLCALGAMGVQVVIRVLRGKPRDGADAARPYLPYGPFLCLATYIVLLTWKWIWMFEVQFSRTTVTGDRLTTFAIRRLFGDWVLLLIIAGLMLGGVLILLALRRAYLTIPVRKTRGA
jgi:leader peptidase (prepilin peptidase)/N-methyltransferase